MDSVSNAAVADSSPVRVPLRTILLSVIGLWVTYFVLVTMRAEMVSLVFSAEILWRRALACVIGIAVTLGLWLVLRLFDGHRLSAKIAVALVLSLPVAVLAAQGNQLAMQPLEESQFRAVAQERGYHVRRSASGDLLVDIPAMGLPGVPGDNVLGPPPQTEEDFANTPSATITADVLMGSYWQQIAEIAFGRYFMLLAWCALYLALLTGEKARAAERREQQALSAAKAAELRSLRYQVNPHFLFNTLNSLSALVLTGKNDSAERMVQMLSRFYRRSLADDPTADVPLAEEIALQRLYLDIEAVRFPLRLVARYEVPEDLADCLVPGMILQPLVENSVKHAVATSSGQVTITLSAREEYGRLVVTVADDGRRAANGSKPAPGYGIGLANVRERVEARFGNEAQIASGPLPDDGGYATHLRLPITRGHKARLAAE